jgi:hypothetical protein
MLHGVCTALQGICSFNLLLLNQIASSSHNPNLQLVAVLGFRRGEPRQNAAQPGQFCLCAMLAAGPCE